MPLFCLLLKRALSVMEKAHDVVLHPDELDIIDESLYTVLEAVRDRVEKLEGKHSHLSLSWQRVAGRLTMILAIYKLQNIRKEEKFQNIFFGLVGSAHESDARY
jgi:hypothetical protein